MAKYRSRAVRFAEVVQKIEDAKQEIEGLDVWTNNREAAAAKEFASKAADAEIEDPIPF